MKLLEDIVVLDFSQYLAGPSCSLRLSDLGARVIKIERPGSGDGSRKMSLKNLMDGDNSILFHTINRNKESFCANLKDPEDLELIKELIKKSDVLIENFRPGVMKKNQLDYASVRQINPGLIYGSITGYGTKGPWVKKPGQDLLVQAMSGLTWLNGNGGKPPAPFCLSVVDSYAGVHLTEGILAAFFRRIRTGEGALVEVSLMESAIDMQFEGITDFLNSGGRLPVRSDYNNAHPYLGAPYGVYRTADSFIALSRGSLKELAGYLDLPALEEFNDLEDAFEKRDLIKRMIGERLAEKKTADWIDVLEKEGYWCSEVYTWETLLNTEGFQKLEFLQELDAGKGRKICTSRCPVKVNGEAYYSAKRGPELGEDNEKIKHEFGLGKEGR